MDKSRHTFLIPLLGIACAFLAGVTSVSAQLKDLEPNDALQTVFAVLSAKKMVSKDSKLCDSLLNIGAWESLAYVDIGSSFNLSLEDVQEAVPDYYQFKKGKLYFKLISPANNGEYGTSGELNYSQDGSIIRLIDPRTKALMDQWEIRYLDQNYLALEMDDLRVFLSRVSAVH